MGQVIWEMSVQTWYLVSEKDQMIPPAARHMFANRMGASVSSINGSHVLMVSHPNEVAAFIMKAAQSASDKAKLSALAPVSADSLEQVFELLIPQFILDPERRLGAPNKHPALAAMRRAYRANGLGGGRIAERAQAGGLHHREVFDFVVANGRAVQLTQTFTFQVSSPLLSERLKAWAWTVDDIRAGGGEARLKTRGIIEVPTDVDIEAVYVPPADGTSNSLVDEGLSAFRKLGVTAVPLTDAASVGRRAVEALAH